MTCDEETTEAAVLFATGQPLRVVRLVIPELQAGQVLVDVAFSGVCHTQVLEARGARGVDRFLPHTLGHEGSGTVVSVGSGVTKVKAGDRVVLSWIKGTGVDVGSTIYRSGSGKVNSGAVSTFMRRTVASENRITTIAGAVPLREAALLGCAVLTGSGIVFNTARVKPGDSIAVLGVGGIGASAVLAAVLARAFPIIAVDIRQNKLELARRLGATHVVNALHEDPLGSIQELTGGHGVDFAVEAAGQRDTMELGFKAIREKGGLLVVAGNLPHGQRISLDPFGLIRGKRLVGTSGGESDPDRDIPKLVELFSQGKLPLEAFLGDAYPLSRAECALSDLEGGKVLRALIDMKSDT